MQRSQLRTIHSALFLTLFSGAFAFAETWHVGAGGKSGDGHTVETAFATIQQAADVVKAGDIVVVGPGVYHESVELRAKGTKEQPIVFKADQIGKGRVIISGADPAIRRKEIEWKLEDKDLGLYSIPWDKPMPSRCLYSGADLYPYSDVGHLREFVAMTVEQLRKLEKAPDTSKRMIFGPRHGYAVDAEKKRLYIRLHPSGKYGPTDPNEHLMCVSPPSVGDYLRSELAKPDFNFGILGKGDAHVVVDGFTFETPSVTGVHTEANDVVVRNSWFVGCPGGVGGTATYGRSKDYKYENFANRVVIEHCEYSQFPTYDDGCELVKLAFDTKAKSPDGPIDPVPSFWPGKDVAGGLPNAGFTYEIGIARLIGRDWIVRRNHVHNAFEGLSARGTTNSDNLHVYENVFDKILDNAIEAEDHASNMHFYRNVVSDTFNPISWQPLKGAPFPGPVFIYQNIIFNRPEHLEVFGFRNAAVFKFLAKSSHLPIDVPAPGFVVFNNTVYWPGESTALIAANRWGQTGFRFHNNILISPFGYYPYFAGKGKWQGDEYVKTRNFIGGTEPGKAGATACAGEGGRTFESFTEIGLEDPAGGKFNPRPDSPVIGAAGSLPDAPVRFKDIGAIQQGDSWYPFQAGPVIGK